jgi:hypothetical protein
MKRLRFTIRDLLWLTLVVALGVVICLDRAAIHKKDDLLSRKTEEVDVYREQFNRSNVFVDRLQRENAELIQAKNRVQK